MKLESDGGEGEDFDTHRCYVQPLAPEKRIDKIIFYNFETYVNSKPVHVPFLVCAVSLDRKSGLRV